MSCVIRIAHTITSPPREAAGGTVFLPNGTELLLESLGVPFLKEMFGALDFFTSNTFGNYKEAATLVANNSADMGSILISHDKIWTEFGIGSTLVYSHPVFWEPSVVYFRERPLSHYKTAVFQPFRMNAWLAYILLSFIVASLMLSLLTTTAPKSKSYRKQNILRLLVKTLELCIARSHHSHPPTLSHRKTDNFAVNIVIIMEVCSTYLMAIYTAKVVSVLILKEHMIKSPEDLVKYGYTISTYSRMHIDRMFGNSKMREIVQSIYKPVAGYDTIDNVLGVHLKDPRQAMISHPNGFYPQAVYGLNYDQELCLISTFEGVRKTPVCFYIRKDSIFREKINLEIVQMMERGFSQRLYRTWQQTHIFKCPTQPVNVSPVSFDHTVFAIYGLVAGSVLGVLIHFC